MSKLSLLYLFLLFAVSCSRCKEECEDSSNPACPNYVDPCLATTEFDSDFIIEQIVRYPDEFWEIGDLVISNRIFKVKCNTPADSVKWIIGADIIEANEYAFTFPEEFEGQTIPLTMITKGTPNISCFPHDNGRDTVTKYVRIIHWTDAPIFGSYRIKTNNPETDSFDVSMQVLSEFDHTYRFQNWVPDENYECDLNDSRVKYTANKLEIINTVAFPCWLIEGVFEVNGDERFSAQFSHMISIDPINYNRVEKLASGRKLE